MPTTSSHFASSLATGTNWRDTAKKVLEDLESVKTTDGYFNFGFLYVTDYLADDLPSILNLFRSVLSIDHWVGTVGMGVCGNGDEHIDKPAISAMIASLDPNQFCALPFMEDGIIEADPALKDWMKQNDTMLSILHADPALSPGIGQALGTMETMIGGFSVGGLTSSRNKHFVIGGTDIKDKAIGGYVFSDQLAVSTTLSQGCQPIGDRHTITRCEGQALREVDGKKAVEVFEEDLRLMMLKKYDIDSNAIRVDEDSIPAEYQHLFKGEVQAAFPVRASDTQDYMVRNILGVDEDSGAIKISQDMIPNDPILFVYRDEETVQSDLSKSLVDLRKRISLEQDGNFNPKGALYISCIARTVHHFSSDSEHSNPETGGEMAFIRDILGDIPLAGYYAGGEIFSGRLYGYTGVLVLFF